MHTRLVALFNFHLLIAPPKGRATKNWSIDSFCCSPPRKSLVKGERFIRVEGKPELTVLQKIGGMLNLMREDMWDIKSETSSLCAHACRTNVRDLA